MAVPKIFGNTKTIGILRGFYARLEASALCAADRVLVARANAVKQKIIVCLDGYISPPALPTHSGRSGKRMMVKPSVDDTAWRVISAASPRKPELVMLTNVVLSGHEVNVHSAELESSAAPTEPEPRAHGRPARPG